MNEPSESNSGKQAVLRGATIIAAVIPLWLIFSPALMSPDSMSQYEQAYNGDFSDWHPPLMAILLRAVFLLGGDIQHLMLLQCLAGVLGLRSVFLRIAELMDQKNGLSNRHYWAYTFLSLLFLLPITPFPYYLMTFWKDAWLAICFLWIFSYLLRLSSRIRSYGFRRASIYLAALSLLMCFSVLLRHNAMVTLPAMALCLFMLAGQSGRRSLRAFAVLPLILPFLLEPVIAELFHVRHFHLQNIIKTMDLSRLFADYPEIRQELPYASLQVGDTPWIIDESYFLVSSSRAVQIAESQDDDLDREYRIAVKKHLYELSKVKLKSFVKMVWDFKIPQSPICFWVQANNYNLTPIPGLEKPRYIFMAIGHNILKLRPMAWASWTHLTWMIVNICLIAASAVVYLKHRTSAFLTIAAAMLIPMSYYLSYVLANTTPEHRMMYPATLCVQVVTVAILISRLANFTIFATAVVCERFEESEQASDSGSPGQRQLVVFVMVTLIMCPLKNQKSGLNNLAIGNYLVRKV